MKEMWLTRDKDDFLYLSIGGKPIKRKVNWSTHRYAYYIELDSCLFPEVQWSDEEPTKVKLIIEK